MKWGVLAAVLMLFAMSNPAKADMVMRDQNGNYVRLHTEPCAISPWTKEWKTATFFYEKKQYAACWRLQGETVVVLDSEGDITPLPVRSFRPETGV